MIRGVGKTWETSSHAADELGKRLHIGRRSAWRISPIGERLVEPSVAPAYSHPALLFPGCHAKPKRGAKSIGKMNAVFPPWNGVSDRA